MTLISHEYGCRFPHSRTYLISTTHSSLISSSILILWHRICPRLPRMPSTFWCLGTLQADASLRTARRFPESLADYNLESILCSFGRYSYHYPPQMILAENQLWSFHSYMRSLRTRTGTTGRLLETSPSFSGKTFPDLVCSAVPIRHGAYAVTLLSTGTYL